MKEYKRLTDSETAVMLKNTEGSSWDSEDMDAQRYIRLAELEDKIENGTLIELPCKVGDTVFVLEKNNRLIKMEIVEYSLSEKLKRYYAVSVFEGYGYWLYESELNKDWFLTKSQAEEKLKELQDEKNKIYR